MFLTELKLRDFRNYSEIEFNYSPHLNCFIGQNAAGKTNILEAIYFLSTLASFRTAKDEDLIRWGKEAFSVIATVQFHNFFHSLQAAVGKNEKQLSVDGNRKEKSVDFAGLIKTVFFSPEDLSLVKGGPYFRRKFLDHFLLQLFPHYHHHIINYRKIVKQKNTLLRDLKNKKTSEVTLLDVYDEQIAKLAAWITLKRLNILKKILPQVKLFHQRINHEEDINLSYQSCILINKELLTYEKLADEYYAAILKVRKDEISRASSLIGPQRDDIIITINNKSLKEFGSQGQQRTATIALKLAQAEIFRSEIGENPVILLDDIFSELDGTRRNNILNLVKNDLQVFITATDMNLIPEEYRKGAKIFKVGAE